MPEDLSGVIFDISREPFTAWLDGGLVIVAGLCAAIAAVTYKHSARLFLAFVASVFVAGGAFVIHGAADEYQSLQSAYDRKAYSVVEGKVTGFLPDPGLGKGTQQFAVGSVKFSISPSIATSSFNRTVSKGGPNLEGSCVRIAYTVPPPDDEPKILWMGYIVCRPNPGGE